MSNYNIYEYLQTCIIVQRQLHTGSESYTDRMYCGVATLFVRKTQ